MEAISILGFVFGMSGLSFGLIALGQVQALKNDLAELRDQLSNNSAGDP